MKRTDQERIERELKRREKKAKIAASRSDKPVADEAEVDTTPSAYIQHLVDLFEHDDVQIYNTKDDDEVMEVLLAMKEYLPEKDWEGVLRSAIRKTKVKEKDLAFDELKMALADC